MYLYISLAPPNHINYLLESIKYKLKILDEIQGK